MSVSVSIPTILRPHVGGAKRVSADGTTLAEVFADLEANHPGLKGRLRDDDGALLRFVNIYVNDEDVRFTGGPAIDPTLDIVAVSDLSDIDATINIRGTGQKPEISFSSVPALPEDELLSRILFGSSITDISEAEAARLAAAVASLRGGGSGLDPINALRKGLGLDRLRILPANTATGQGTSVAAGKYLTRRLFVEIVTDGQGYSATRAEFQITRWLSILSSISTIGRQSLNARVQKDY